MPIETLKLPPFFGQVVSKDSSGLHQRVTIPDRVRKEPCHGGMRKHRTKEFKSKVTPEANKGLSRRGSWGALQVPPATDRVRAGVNCNAIWAANFASELRGVLAVKESRDRLGRGDDARHHFGEQD